MVFKNNEREWTEEELELFKEIEKNGPNPSISEQSAFLSKLKEFTSKIQDRVTLNTEVIDVSECDDDSDIPDEDLIDDGKEQVFTAMAKTPTNWEDSIFKKIFCDIFVDRLQEELEDDEKVLKSSMRNVLRMFNFETLLWIQKALESRKIANVFEIFNKRETLPAAVEKDRQFFMNSIKNIKSTVLPVFIFKYRSKIEGEQVSDDLKFVHNKYMKFLISEGESLSNLYKMIKNLKSEFIQNARSIFEKKPFDSTTFVVVSKKDSIQFVCHNMIRSIMYIRQNGNKTLKEVRTLDIPYGKYYRNFLKKTKISTKNKNLFYLRNDVELDTPTPQLTQRFY